VRPRWGFLPHSADDCVDTWTGARHDLVLMRKTWAAAFAQRAEAYWTPARTRNQLGDKHLLLPPARSGPLLRALGLLKGDASMSPESVRKYMQINHMVALLEPLMLDLAKAYPLVRIVDLGCGRSYLALLLAWCFRERYQHPVQVLGVDRNDQVIETCRERVPMAGLEDVLRFEAMSIDSVDLAAAWLRAFGGRGSGRVAAGEIVHALLALHACDTATDDALALGLSLKVQIMAAAPCCHAELACSWSELDSDDATAPFAPIWGSPHLRREAGATMTDALRTLLLRGCGYTVTPMEFVPAEHTPKNTLLRAVRSGQTDCEALRAYLALRQALGGSSIRLEKLLPAEAQARLRELER
jgi:hypothetical protein